MAKPPQENWPERRVNRTRYGIEFYSYPSAMAKGYFYHTLSLGRVKLPAGYRHEPGPRAGFLIHYTRRGTLWQARRGQEWEVGRGTVSLVDFSEDNACGNKGPSQVHLWWLLFDGKDMPHLFTELRADRHPLFDLLDTGRFESLFLELLTLTQTRPSAYEAKSFAVLVGLLAELSASRIKRETLVGLVGQKTVLSEPVRKGIDYMTRFHGDSSLGLRRICDAANLSERHFARLFRDEVGMTPIQYLTHYRIEQAKQLLVFSDKTMEQIARMVGTNNQSYFSYLFHKLTGSSPREHRAKARKAEQGLAFHAKDAKPGLGRQ